MGNLNGRYIDIVTACKEYAVKSGQNVGSYNSLIETEDEYGYREITVFFKCGAVVSFDETENYFELG